MKAKVIKEFYGVLDGQVHPRMVEIGEIIHGDLATVALKEKWATTDFEEDAPPQPVLVEKPPDTAPERPKWSPADSSVTYTPAEVQALTPIRDALEKRVSLEVQAPIEIPEDWRALKWRDLKSLAEKVKSAPVANVDEARVAIEAELTARAAK